MLPTHILVPTDFGEGAEEALAYACELASKLGATVHLLNVIGIPAMGVPELGVAITSAMIDSIIQENQALLDRIVAAHQGKATFGQALLRTGDARDIINQTAIELSCELIVMATHGRRGVSRLLLGSVAESVVRTAPCPVLAIRPHTTEARTGA